MPLCHHELELCYSTPHDRYHCTMLVPLGYGRVEYGVCTIWYINKNTEVGFDRDSYKTERGKCVISHTFTPSRITTVSFSSLRDFKLSLISRWAFNLLTLLALCKLISPLTAIQLESCGRSQFVDPELVLSVFHLNCRSCDDPLSN